MNLVELSRFLLDNSIPFDERFSRLEREIRLMIEDGVLQYALVNIITAFSDIAPEKFDRPLTQVLTDLERFESLSILKRSTCEQQLQKKISAVLESQEHSDKKVIKLRAHARCAKLLGLDSCHLQVLLATWRLQTNTLGGVAAYKEAHLALLRFSKPWNPVFFRSISAFLTGHLRSKGTGFMIRFYSNAELVLGPNQADRSLVLGRYIKDFIFFPISIYVFKDCAKELLQLVVEHWFAQRSSIVSITEKLLQEIAEQFAHGPALQRVENIQIFCDYVLLFLREQLKSHDYDSNFAAHLINRRLQSMMMLCMAKCLRVAIFSNSEVKSGVFNSTVITISQYLTNAKVNASLCEGNGLDASKVLESINSLQKDVTTIFRADRRARFSAPVSATNSYSAALEVLTAAESDRRPALFCRQDFLQRIPAKLIEVCQRLDKMGYHVMIVGGCIPDWLTNKTPHDIDLRTTAPLLVVKSLLPGSMIRGHYIEVLTVTMDNMPVEFTSFEKTHSDLFEMLYLDSQLRTSTFKALYFDVLTGVIYDFFEGVKALQRNKVVMVRDADEMFEEDPLRIMGLCRDHVRYGVGESLYCVEMAEFSPRIASCHPKKRLFIEMKKTLEREGAYFVVEQMVCYGVLQALMPDVAQCFEKNNSSREFFTTQLALKADWGGDWLMLFRIACLLRPCLTPSMSKAESMKLVERNTPFLLPSIRVVVHEALIQCMQLEVKFENWARAGLKERFQAKLPQLKTLAARPVPGFAVRQSPPLAASATSIAVGTAAPRT